MTGLRSTCAYCGVGCGVILTPTDGGLQVDGDPDHPANHGRLCSKGSALGETVGLDNRLLAPRMGGQDVSWDTALDTVATRFAQTIADHGPDSVALYVSGQLLTEDYYVANKLAKGVFGTANIDTNSRLCMASSVAGHKRAFGTDTVPGTYEDLDEADLVVLVGSNLAWCHPILYQRVLAARAKRGTKIVVVDPRRTASCDQADLHLALAPGADVALFNRLLVAIADAGAVDADYLNHTTGFDDALAAARADLADTDLSDDDIAQFCQMWIDTPRVVTIYSQGVNQSTSGSDKVNAILNCHLATGRIGTPGCGPFSVTGQPNAMGGREVGGLANMLACHLDLENPDHRGAVERFWGCPPLPQAPGLKAVDMFRAVETGQIKALWIIHTNPAVSMPDADRVRDAIAGCAFTVVSDITAQTDTARLADVVLPAAAWAEKDGSVTNSDRTISRQRKVLPPPGQARPDWQILAQVACRIGHADGFSYENPAQIFREYAALSGIAAGLGRDFDISGLAEMTDAEYATMTPQRWPISSTRQGGRFFADGRFFHPDGKARFLALTSRAPAAQVSRDAPFRLNTGRLRDQWHTMTRTALSPRLAAHLPEPFVDIHPRDARDLGIEPADLVQVTNAQGGCILRARITRDVAPGQVFAPMHWTGETAPSGRIDALVAGHTDPVSGQPESKAAVVKLEKYQPKWHGFAVSLAEMQPNSAYWAQVRTAAGYRAELAGDATPESWSDAARQLFGLPNADLSLVDDPAKGMTRMALFDQGVLKAALFVAPHPMALARDHLATLPGSDGAGVLTGRIPAGVPNPGPTVCACLGVGMNTILSAIEDQNLSSVDAITAATGAGGNCGSCRSELRDLLAASHAKEAAQ